jgi:hypothetical protein
VSADIRDVGLRYWLIGRMRLKRAGHTASVDLLPPVRASNMPSTMQANDWLSLMIRSSDSLRDSKTISKRA